MSSTLERVGRYQLLEPIGTGPCGTVSRAKVFGVAGFERQFAIKRFHPELTVTTALAQALSTAARAYGSLEHPRIARMAEFGVAQGQTFTAVEFVGGLDAARLIGEAKLASAPLSPGGALALVSQAARAIGYAHGRGLTHLGIAPTNVLVTADGDVKITDFGMLAAGLPQRPAEIGRLAHRIAYLAPEQLANEPASAATDVFALGVLAYELVTGERAFRGATPALIAAAITSNPPPEAPLPRPIARVLQRCLARSPFERFPDARALADALDAALRVAPVPGTRKDIGEQVKQTMDRLAELNASEMSGMVALNVGTGPAPKFTPDVLGAPEVPGTPDVTSRDMPRVIATMAGVIPPPPPGSVAPPSPPPAMPPGGASTLLGLPALKPSSGAIPSMRGGGPPAPPRPPSGPIPPALPRTPTPSSIAPPPPALPRTLTPSSIGGPPTLPALPRTLTPPSVGRTVTPPPSPAPLKGLELDGLFEGVETPPPPPRTRSRRVSSLAEPAENDTPTAEIAQLHLDALTAEAARRSTKLAALTPATPAPSPGADDGWGDLDAVNAEVDAALDAAVEPAVGPAPLPPVPTPAASSIEDALEMELELGASDDSDREPPDDEPLPPVRVIPRELPPRPRDADSDTTPVRADAPAPAPAPAATPAAAPTPPPAPEVGPAPRRSRGPLVAVLGLVVAGGAGLAAWQIVASRAPATGTTAPVAGTAPVAPPRDAAVIATTTPDAAAPAPDAAAAPEDAAAVVAEATDAGPGPDADAAAPVPADATAVAVAPPDAAPPTPTPPPTPIRTAATAGKLVITSTPPGAHAYLDGADLGVTPVEMAGSSDRHTLSLLLPGHDLYVADVDGSGAFTIPLAPVTWPKGPAGIKVIKCKDATRYYIHVDGKPTGQLCPSERIDTTLGVHTVEVYDAVSEARKKFDVEIKDTRLSHRVKIE